MASEAVEDSSADDSVKCIRSDGLIVEGKNEGCFHKIQDEHGFGIIMYAIQSFFCTFNFLILEVIGALRLGRRFQAINVHKFLFVGKWFETECVLQVLQHTA